MPLQSDVYSRLSALKTHDDAAKLFSLLNYEYTAQSVSLKRFPSSLDGRINTLQILAEHDDFKIFHCEVDQLLLGVERPIIDNLLRDNPYSLFLFSDTTKSNWHFINVKYDEEETRRKLFRRIVVGPDERLHTAAQRISLLEIPDARTLSPLDLQQQHDGAFDVEVVTKEFFSSFVQMFHLLRAEIEELNPRYKTKSAEFSQVLLNRLMFLYFIQKKGWLDGNTSYLYDRYRKAYKDQQAKHNYYSEVLLLIFKKLANADLQFKQLGTVPFLNGGLFESEPWEDVLKISNGLFGKLFKDLFEHYNFTVREDTAMDMEVAIDPEMLGKVFENLILQLEKDPTTDLRKATGSYYTPRVIVHFMCQQSLKEYLIENSTAVSADEGQKTLMREKIEKLISLNPASQLTTEEVLWLKSSFANGEAERIKNLIFNCRVCDPAVGSGAFVVGMLHEMVAIIKLLDMASKGFAEIQKQNYDYELKRKIIEYCLYGVDIQKPAVRICELRLWLSLIVDYEKDDKPVPPLPNLNYRILRGNSLIDQLFGYNVNLNIKVGSEKGEKIQQLVDNIQSDKHNYFYESDIEKKHRAEVGILAKQCDLALHYLKLRLDQVLEEFEAKYSRGLFVDRNLKKAEEEEKMAMKQDMKELEGLMLHVRRTKDKLTKGVTWGKKSIDEIKETFGLTFVWKLDFAEVFKDRNGFDIIIGNPPYLNARIMLQRYGQEFKDVISGSYSCARGTYDIYVLFWEMSLRLIQKRGTINLIVPNKIMVTDYAKETRKLLSANLILRLAEVSELLPFEEASVYPIILQVKNGQPTDIDETNLLYNLKSLDDLGTHIGHLVKQIDFFKDQGETWSLTHNTTISLNVSENFMLLSEVAKVHGGITGFMAQSVLGVLSEGYHKNESIPFIVSGNIDPYRIEFGNTRYMNILFQKPYLYPDFTVISRGKWQLFQDNKIVIAGMTKRIEAAYSIKPLAVGVAVYSITDWKIDPLYLLAILNSDYISKWYNEKFRAKHLAGGYLSINKGQIEQILIPQVDDKKIRIISNDVGELLKVIAKNDLHSIENLKAKIENYVTTCFEN